MKVRLFYEPDGAPAGADQPAPTQEAPPDQKPEAKPEPPKAAKFASQLSPELREKYKKELSEDYGDKTLNDAWSDLMESRGKLSRAVVIPNPKDEDQERYKAEYKAFLERMGIPENPDGYEIAADKKLFDDNFMKSYKEDALKMGLTKSQAKGVFAKIEGLAKQGVENIAKARKSAEANLEPSLVKAVGGDKAEAEKTMNLAKKYLIRFKDKAVLQQMADSGLMFNATFIKRAAELERAMADEKFIDGKGPDRSTVSARKGAFGNNYNKEFEAIHGGKR